MTSTRKPTTTKASTSQQPSKKPKQKTPKQPLPVPERLKRLFTSLCAQIDGGHFSNAIKTCDKILRLEPKDTDALQTKLFLLLQTEQYNTALSLINNDEAFAGYAFEKAYSLYRLHHESEAKEVLNVIKSENADERGVLHLEAQLNYREGSYQPAFDLYNQLLDTAEPRTEEHSDILTNLEAAQKHLDFINTGFRRALDALPVSTISNLESAAPPQQVSSLAASLASNTVAPEVGSAKKVKKVRLKRVPAGVTPGVTPPPDPERWLKKSERSTFGQGGKRRKGGGGATQGAMESTVVSSGAGGHGGKSSGKAKKKK